MRSFLVAAAKPFAALVALAAWTIAAHWLFSDSSHPRTAILFAWAPIAAATVLLTRTSAHRVAWLAAVAVATLLIGFVTPGHDLDPSLLWQFQYLAMQAALGAFFGRTLLPGREPLVTRFARLVHGDLPPRMARYTRQVTIAWAVFFALMAAVAIALYAFASRELWSAFVNLLTIPCVLAMFVAEYSIRRLRFPGFEHSSLLAGAQAFHRAFMRRDPPP